MSDQPATPTNGAERLPAEVDGNSLARSALRRGARLASLPLGFAGRATLGLGRRLGGAPAEEVSEQLQQRAAEQLFRVLGELKGGAMKFGQALSLFESVLPEDVAAPYRVHLARRHHECMPYWHASSAPGGGRPSPNSIRCQRRLHPSVKSTKPRGLMGVRSRSRFNTPELMRPCAQTCGRSGGCPRSSRHWLAVWMSAPW